MKPDFLKYADGLVPVIIQDAASSKVLMLATFKQHANRQTREELNILLQKGFSRMYVNDEMIRIEELLELGDEELDKKVKSQKSKVKSQKSKVKNQIQNSRFKSQKSNSKLINHIDT